MPHHVRPLAVLVALAAAAVAAVDVEIDPNAKTQGSLAAPGEVDTYRFFATAGADLSIALKAAKKTDLDLAAMLEGPGAVPVDLEGARKVKDTGKKLLVKGLTLPSTGTYTLTVGGGEGVGDYALRLRAKARRKIVETYSLGPGEEAFVEVPAPRGSSLRIKAKGGDGAVPRIGEDPPKAPGDSLRDDDVTGGDLTYRVVNDGDSGTVQVKVTVKAPKVPLDRVDVRSGSLGEPDGGETAISATVSAADGGAVTVGDVVSPLFGAGVDIPPGGLLSDTRITVASSSTIPVPVPESQRAAGPAMEFGPDGLEFQVDAEVTIPFDPSAVPPGTDPDDVVRVVRQSSDGSQEIIVPSGVDMDDGLVTAPTSGFSRFMVFVPRGVPDLRDRGYWEIAYRLHHKPDDSGARDSRRRDLSVGIGALELSSFGDYFREFVTFSTGFEHDENGVGMVFPSTPFPEFETGTWSYDPSGQAVILFAGGGPGGGFGKGLLGAEQQQGYDLSVDGRVLVGFNRGNPDPSVELDLLVRRSRSPQSVASLAGTYTLAGLAIDAHETQSGGPLFLARSHERGALTIGAGGAVSAAVDVFTEVFDPALGVLTRRERFSDGGTLTRDDGDESVFHGTFVLETADGSRVRILPSDDGRILVGFDEPVFEGPPGAPPVSLFVAVRRASGMSESLLSGPYTATFADALEIAPYSATGSPGGGFVGDFVFGSVHSYLRFDGTRTVTVEFEEEREVFRADVEGGAAGDLVFDEEVDREGFRLQRDGTFRSTDDDPALVGAVSQNGVFGVLVDDPRAPEGASGLGILIQLPPPTVAIPRDR